MVSEDDLSKVLKNNPVAQLLFALKHNKLPSIYSHCTKIYGPLFGDPQYVHKENWKKLNQQFVAFTRNDTNLEALKRHLFTFSHHPLIKTTDTKKKKPTASPPTSHPPPSLSSLSSSPPPPNSSSSSYIQKSSLESKVSIRSA